MVEAEEIENPTLIINRIKPHMAERGDMMRVDDVLEILAISLLGLVPDDESIVVTTNRGVPAILDKKSQAGIAYTHIALRIMGEDIPLMDLRSRPTGLRGLFGRIKQLFSRRVI